MEVYLGLSSQTYNVGDALSDEAIGAEGSICEINGNVMLVAKIYHEDIAESESNELENKLKLMINKKIVETQGVFSIAWPRDLLYKIVNGKKIFAGYTMRKVSASYNLSDLTHHNPDDPDPDPNGIDGYITWREFIQAAYNLSRLVEYLHKNGIEIGDFNERNFLFDEKTGGFGLIDCGTYGLFDTKTLKTIYPCRYSMPKYSAPEKLLGLDISDPKSTDCFYLAIHVFHLLMQNSEPFGYKENSDGNPISKLHEHISNGDCLYVKSIPGKVLRKHSIKPGVLPDDILKAFNRTFNYTRDNLPTRIKERTTASEWCKVLEPYLIDDSRIKKCAVKIEHVYSSHLKECPWCKPSSVSDKPYELRVNTESSSIQAEGTRHGVIGPNDPCPCGSGRKYKNCHGRDDGKLAEVCDVLASQMHSGDDYLISEPINEKNIFITLDGIKRIETFFQIDNFNDPANEQIEKGIREAICRKERKLKESDKGAAAKVKALIDAIGKVTYTEECRKKISTARIAFSNLTVPQRMLVPTDKLSKAEAEYEKLKKAAEDGNKKKRTVGIVAAALAACVVIALFSTGILHFGNQTSELSSSFIASAKQGDEFILGKYEQDNNLEKGTEDIEWIVLGNDNGTITAISKYCIEDMPFNDADIDSSINWADSSIREWLNGDFYETAFSNDEKSIIKLNHLSNPGNSYFSVDGGEDTDDYVFLIGEDTIESYYDDYKFGAVEMSWDGVDDTMTVGMSDQTEYEPLKAQYTEYARQKYIEAEPQVDYDAVEKEYGKNSCFWWTRVTGDADYSMFQIINSGAAMSVPAKANCGIRPMICIDAESYSNLLQKDNNYSSNDIDTSVGGGWGDSDGGRPSYTIGQIDSGVLGDTITFNSISDGKIGDEKNFVAAKVAGAEVEYWNANSIEVQDGETYTIRLYVHNNNPNRESAVAEDVKATFSLPTTVSRKQTIIGYLDSSNAHPTRYWDGVTLNSDDYFYIEYVDGSVKYTNSSMGSISLANSVITSGVLLGYDNFDGKIPGDYDGVVTIDVTVHKSVTSKLELTARLIGNKEWDDVVWANVGDEIEFQIEYENLLNDTVENVMIRDVLPTNIQYIEGTTYLFNSNYKDGVLLVDDTVTTSGINIGAYSANGNAYVRFTGKVVNSNLAAGDNQLVNWANVTVADLVYKDDVSVMVSVSE